MTVGVAEANVGSTVAFTVTLEGDFSGNTTATAALTATRSDANVLGAFALEIATPITPENDPPYTGSGAQDSWDINVPRVESASNPIAYIFRAECLEPGTSSVAASLDWSVELGDANGTQTDTYDEVTFTCLAGGGGGEVTAGDYSTIGGPEGAVFIDPDHFTAAGLLGNPHAVIAGSTGYQIHSLVDGASVGTAQGAYYGAVVGNESLLSFGSAGYFLQDYDSENGEFAAFGQLGEFMSNITGAAIVANPLGGVLSILVANNTNDELLSLSPIQTEFGPSFEQAASPVLNFADHLSGIPGNIVDVYSPEGDGPILGISDDPGNAGHVFWVDLSNPGGIVDVGEVGEGPRRITCLEPAGTPCAVSSFNAGQVTILDWADRNSAPTIRDTPVSVDGPIGCDMALVSSVPTVLCTGFNDDSLHFITVDGATVTDSSSTLTDCDGPGHAIFVEDSHTLVTCNLSGNFQVTDLP